MKVGGGQWEGVVVVVVGGGARLDAHHVFTLAGVAQPPATPPHTTPPPPPSQALPLSVTGTNQGLITPLPGLGAEHTTVAEQGSSSHPGV